MSEDTKVRGRAIGSHLPGYLPARLLAFFAANPDEELTYRDGRVKFGASERALHNAVAKLAAKQELEAVTIFRLPSKGRR